MAKKKKKTKKRLIAVSLAGILVTGGIGAAVYAKVNYQNEAPKEISTAQSATAKIGSISNTIVGTGNLELETAQTLSIPSGIEVKEVLVESGDYVQKGEILAEVDKTSVIHAVEDIQEEISELDQQISDCLDDEEADTIHTSVDGRVKLIYASAEQDVADVMLEQGALMVLSLDGKMAVDISGDCEAVTEGDSVIVTLSSGTQVEGSVEKANSNGCTVTLTDNGTVFEDLVSVTASDGSVVGQGTLYIHQPLEITGASGVVDTVNVSENQSVTADTELLTLKDAVNQNEYQELLARREACTQSLKKLLSLTKDQSIIAEYSGTVQDVNVSANSSSTSQSSGSADSGSSGGSASASGSVTAGTSVKASQMSFTYNNAGTLNKENAAFVSLAFTDDSQDLQDSKNSWDSQDEADDPGTICDSNIMFDDDTEAVVFEETTVQELYFDIAGSGGSTSSVLVIPAPVTGNVPATDASASDGSYSAAIVWNPSVGSFEPETDYQALVILSASDGYAFTAASVGSVEIGALSGVQVSQDGKSMELQIAFPRTAQADGGGTDPDSPGGSQDGDDDSGSGSDSDQGNGDGQANSGTPGSDGSDTGDFGSSGENSSQTGGGTTGNGTESGSGTSGAGSSQTGSGTSGTGSSQTGSGFSGSGSSQTGSGTTGTGSSGQTGSGDSSDSDSQKSGTVEESEYSTDVTAFTISPDDFMLLSVNVDELDINSLELGQKAAVTFDAIEDEQFEGEVISIGNTASVNGGVAKYTVGIRVAKDTRMRQGMNASATIVIESKENVVTLPMLALQEKGSKVFVYTAQSEDGTLTGEQEITTGLSDGNTVEITEGLSEGDVVYYQKIGSTQNSSFGGGGAQGGFGGSGTQNTGGDFGGMGQMGDGGSRPDRSGQSSGSGGGKTPPGM